MTIIHDNEDERPTKIVREDNAGRIELRRGGKSLAQYALRIAELVDKIDVKRS